MFNDGLKKIKISAAEHGLYYHVMGHTTRRIPAKLEEAFKAVLTWLDRDFLDGACLTDDGQYKLYRNKYRPPSLGLEFNVDIIFIELGSRQQVLEGYDYEVIRNLEDEIQKFEWASNAVLNPVVLN